MRARAWIAAAVLALAPPPLAAQAELDMGQLRSPVLTIDVDRLLAETVFGRRLADEIRAETEALVEENERLRADLTEEERSLAERRPTMEVEAFRAEAEAFDARVQQVRAERDAKQQALNAAVEEGRRAFLNAVSPVLAGLMVDSGAAVILERQSVFLAAGVIDVTDEAIAAIDAELGDGTELPSEPRDAPDRDPAVPEEVPPAVDPPAEAVPPADPLPLPDGD